MNASPQARRAVVLAQEEARMLGDDHIGSEHLLLGLLRDQDGVAVQVLASFGVTMETARQRVRDTEEASMPTAGSPQFTARAKRVLS